MMSYLPVLYIFCTEIYDLRNNNKIKLGDYLEEYAIPYIRKNDILLFLLIVISI